MSEQSTKNERREVPKERISQADSTLSHEYCEGQIYYLQQLYQIYDYSKIIKIELENCRLESVPKELWETTHVRELSLARNQIKTIQDWLFLRMRELTDLSFAENILQSLPASLAQADNLQVLNLNNNRLKYLPCLLFPFKLLCLDISSNDLRSLPQSFAKMQSLQELTFDWFQYTTPPMFPIQRRHSIYILFTALEADQNLQQKKALQKQQPQQQQLLFSEVENNESVQVKKVEGKEKAFEGKNIQEEISNLLTKQITEQDDQITLSKQSTQLNTSYDSKAQEQNDSKMNQKKCSSQTSLIDSKDKKRNSLMHNPYINTKEFGFMQFIKLFSESNQLKTIKEDGTIAHEAVRNQDSGALFCITTFMQQEVNTNLRDNLDLSQHSPLSLAIELEHYFCAKVLLDAGADTSKGPTPPLIQAVANLEYFLISDLLDHGASVEQVDKQGNSCLHELFGRFDGSESEIIKIAQILLLHGADPNKLNKQRLTPLHIAALKGNYMVIKFAINYNKQNQIIQHQFNFSARGGDEKNTILHIASEKCFTDIVEIIVYNLLDNFNFIKRNSIDKSPFALGQRHTTISKLIKKAEVQMISMFSSCFESKKTPISQKSLETINMRHFSEELPEPHSSKSLILKHESKHRSIERQHNTIKSNQSLLLMTNQQSSQQFISHLKRAQTSKMNNNSIRSLEEGYSAKIKETYSEGLVILEPSFKKNSSASINRIDAFSNRQLAKKTSLAEIEEIPSNLALQKRQKLMKAYKMQLYCDYDDSSEEDNEKKIENSPQIYQLQQALLQEKKLDLLENSDEHLSSSQLSSENQLDELKPSLNELQSLTERFMLKQKDIEKEASICFESARGIMSSSSCLQSRITSMLQLQKASKELQSVSFLLSFNKNKSLEGDNSKDLKQSHHDLQVSLKEQLQNSKQISKDSINKVFEGLFQERDILKASRKYSTNEDSIDQVPIKDNIAIARNIQLQRKTTNDQLIYLFSSLFSTQFTEKQQEKRKHRRNLYYKHFKQQQHPIENSNQKSIQLQAFQKADLEADQDMSQNLIAYFESAQTQQQLVKIKDSLHKLEKLENEALKTQASQTEDESSLLVDQPSVKLNHQSQNNKREHFVTDKISFRN